MSYNYFGTFLCRLRHLMFEDFLKRRFLSVTYFILIKMQFRYFFRNIRKHLPNFSAIESILVDSNWIFNVFI